MVAAVRTFDCTNCGATTLDRILAAAAIVSVLVAVYAAWHARQSSNDAHEQLSMYREEHKRLRAEWAKAPSVSATLEPYPVEVVGKGRYRIEAQLPVQIVLRLGIHNGGDAPAEHVTANLLVPEEVEIGECDQLREHWNPIQALHTPEFVDPERSAGIERWRYWNKRLDVIAGAHDVGHFNLPFPREGVFPIGVSLKSVASSVDVVDVITLEVIEGVKPQEVLDAQLRSSPDPERPDLERRGV